MRKGSVPTLSIYETSRLIRIAEQALSDACHANRRLGKLPIAGLEMAKTLAWVNGLMAPVADPCPRCASLRHRKWEAENGYCLFCSLPVVNEPEFIIPAEAEEVAA